MHTSVKCCLDVMYTNMIMWLTLAKYMRHADIQFSASALFIGFRKWIWKDNTGESSERVTTLWDKFVSHDSLWFSRDNMFLFCFRNNLLWLHTVFAVLYLILTVILLRRHTSQIKGMRRETVSHWLLLDYVHLHMVYMSLEHLYIWNVPALLFFFCMYFILNCA